MFFIRSTLKENEGYRSVPKRDSRSLPFYTVDYRCLPSFVALCRPSLDRPFPVTIQSITETIHEYYIELGIVLNDDDLFWMVTANVWI